LHGTGIGELMKRVNRVHAAANARLTASDLTRALEAAYAAYQPPLVRGHAPKLRYAHPGGTNPPTIVIHGSRTKNLAESYRRYLENFFRKRYRLEGTPIRIDFREGENPYAGRKNVPSEGQQKPRPRTVQSARRGKR
jgi:GTP-binding protein